MKKLKVGSTVLVGKAKEVKAKVISISKKVRIRREDKTVDTYVYEKDIVRVVEDIVKVSKAPKYVQYIINCLEEGDATVASLIRRLPNLQSKTGYIRPSQLTNSIKHLIDNGTIVRDEKKVYRLV